MRPFQRIAILRKIAAQHESPGQVASRRNKLRSDAWTGIQNRYDDRVAEIEEKYRNSTSPNAERDKQIDLDIALKERKDNENRLRYYYSRGLDERDPEFEKASQAFADYGTVNKRDQQITDEKRLQGGPKKPALDVNDPQAMYDAGYRKAANGSYYSLDGSKVVDPEGNVQKNRTSWRRHPQTGQWYTTDMFAYKPMEGETQNSPSYKKRVAEFKATNPDAARQYAKGQKFNPPTAPNHTGQPEWQGRGKAPLPPPASDRTPPPAEQRPSAQPPVQPPVQPPAKAPANAPAQAPAKAPAQPPVQPPVQPPAQAPANAPAKPPAKAPAQAPAKAPAQAPAKAPAKPPAKAPANAPAKAQASAKPVTPTTTSQPASDMSRPAVKASPAVQNWSIGKPWKPVAKFNTGARPWADLWMNLMVNRLIPEHLKPKRPRSIDLPGLDTSVLTTIKGA